VHSAQCAMCAAVPCTRARDGTAGHVAGEGRVASAIGGEGERTLNEREMICLLWCGGGCRFDTASWHTCTVHCTHAGILCTSDIAEDCSFQIYDIMVDRGLQSSVLMSSLLKELAVIPLSGGCGGWEERGTKSV
jgi:hypothetical protein